MIFWSNVAPPFLFFASRVYHAVRYHAFVEVPKASFEFQVFAKPAGPACNLDCRHCYDLEKSRLYPDAPMPRMSAALLEEYIRQHIDACPTPTVSFSWHGGEPTILGLEYFRRIVEIQRGLTPPGRRVFNGIQTNGILLDEDWCRFLAAEGFGVGLSLDGPAELHDHYRVTRGGEPTHAQTMRGYDLLLRHRVSCDILCAVHDHNVRRPSRVYRFFREIGVKYLSYLPVVRAAAGGAGPESLPSEAYGTFLCSIFDEWIRRDAGRIMVQAFEEASRPDRGLDHSLCIFRETCGEIPVVEHNGDFYSCDHFVDPEHRLGNIRDTPLVELLESPAQMAFGRAKRDALPSYCRACEVRALCNGGCPKDRFLQTPDGEPGLHYLCAGLKSFFMYSRPQLARLTNAQRTAPVRAAPSAGRNDPCPCGSGRKYKNCCLA
jgi:uncharacterized protein